MSVSIETTHRTYSYRAKRNQLHTVFPQFSTSCFSTGQLRRVRRLVHRPEKVLKPEASSSFSTHRSIDIVSITGVSTLSTWKTAAVQNAASVGLWQRCRLLGQQADVEVTGGPFQTVKRLSRAFHSVAEPWRLAAEGGRGSASDYSRCPVGVVGERSDCAAPVVTGGSSLSRGRCAATRWSTDLCWL